MGNYFSSYGMIYNVCTVYSVRPEHNIKVGKYVKVYLRSLSSNNLTMFSVPTFGWYCGTWCVVTKQNILFVCCKMQVCRFSIPIQREAKATHLCRHSCETHLSTPSYRRSFSGQRDRSLFVLAVSHCQSVRCMHPYVQRKMFNRDIWQVGKIL